MIKWEDKHQNRLPEATKRHFKHTFDDIFLVSVCKSDILPRFAYFLQNLFFFYCINLKRLEKINYNSETCTSLIGRRN